MEIFQDDEQDGKVTVIFDFDELSKITVESTRTGRLIVNVMRDVLVWGLEEYPYRSKENATYVS